VSREAVANVANSAAFRPTNQPWLLSERHVPFDDLLGTDPGFEKLAARRLTDGVTDGVAVIGPSGAGKSSFVAWVTNDLPASHAAILIPVSALSDPTDTAEALRLALGVILDTIRLDASEREELHIERADQRTAVREPTGVTGGRIGGGPIPASVNVQVGSLRQEFLENKLQGEFAGGVMRAVEVIREQGVVPVFVFEDTEAIVGGDDETARADAFFAGPLRFFVQELHTPCLVAVQTHLTESEPYQRLAAAMETLEIPRIGGTARAALASILGRRLQVAGGNWHPTDVLADDALDGLVQFYDEKSGDFRKVLAAAHDATEHAAGMGAELVRAAHVRVGTANWR
jgi:hypothetical protein